MLTPLPEESCQRSVHQVILHSPSSERTLHEPHLTSDVLFVSSDSIVPNEPLLPRRSQRLNKGLPRPQYDPDLRTSMKYPINNYVSTHMYIYF